MIQKTIQIILKIAKGCVMTNILVQKTNYKVNKLNFLVQMVRRISLLNQS